MKIEMKILNKKFYQTDQIHDTEYYRIPKYATQGSAAIDLVCTEDVTLFPGETKMIPTGLAIWIGSEDHKEFIGQQRQHVAGLILPRSGLGTKGLVLANTIGLIDEDYKNELMVSAWNRNNGYKGNAVEQLYRRDIVLKAGDRFAQLMFIPIIKAQFDIVEEFSDPTIIRGGFGSTGV